MNSIRINTDIQSVAMQTEALKELTYRYFPNYEVIHKMAKQDNKAVAIDLLFGNDNNGEFTPFTCQQEELDLVSNILSVLTDRERREPGEYAKSEIAFFAQACKNKELSELVRIWLIRVATYNFGPYSKTMAYPDLSPVAFWAAFFFALNNPEEMDVYINYISSLRLVNHNKRKWFHSDRIDGFCYPNTLVLNDYLYNQLGWNNETIKLFCAHISHYVYEDIPDEFMSLLYKNKLKTYLSDESHLDFFINTYKQRQKAHHYDFQSSGADDVIDTIFPLIIDDDRLKSIKSELLKELD